MVCVASLHLQRRKRCTRVAHVAAAEDWFYCWINGRETDSGFSTSHFDKLNARLLSYSVTLDLPDEYPAKFGIEKYA
jgi:hypothetical protein